MKTISPLRIGIRCAVLILLGLGGAAHPAFAQSPPPRSQPTSQAPGGDRPIWVCAYYLAGEQEKGPLTPQKIDYTAISHLIHFGIFPNSDGTIDPMTGGITPDQSKTVIALAHAAGRKVLVCLGTDENAIRLRQAISDAARPTLVRSLVRYILKRGYDGVDIDIEPLDDPDAPNYEKFICDLRAGLNAAKPGLLLTAAVASQPEMFGRLQSRFDRINLMTYDLSGPWPGFKTWYNAALFDGGAERMNATEPYPSVQGMVRQYVQAGTPAAKLGIGIAFYGYLWSGANGPRQSIEGVKVNDDVAYHTIMEQYYRPDRYHWDEQAQAPYLSIDAPQPKDRGFLSYDDETLCARKIAYTRREGLGGVIIWVLSEGYCDGRPEGKKDALLQSIKHAWLNPSPN